MRVHQQRAAWRFIAAARFHSNETVLDKIDASNAVFTANAIQRFEQLDAGKLLPFTDTGTPFSKPIVTSVGLSGASWDSS